MRKYWSNLIGRFFSSSGISFLGGSEAELIELLGGGRRSKAGERVNPSTILSNPAVWNGVSLISGRLAKVPIILYRRDEGSRTKAIEHPAYRLLSVRPSKSTNITPSVFRQSLAHDAIIYGNAYQYILRNDYGDPEELLWLDPAQTILDAGGYKTIMNDKEWHVPASDVIHLRGLSKDGGKTGIALYDVLRDSLGLGLALQSYAAYYFANNATPSVVIKLPASYLADNKREKLNEFRKEWEENFSGLQNSQRPAFLPPDSEVIPLTATNRESQWIEAREHDLVCVSNALSVPASKLGSRNQISYASLESDEKNFLSQLDNWLVKLEEELQLKLLREDELLTERYYIEANRKTLIQVDAATEQALLDRALMSGRRSWQETRAIENLPTDEALIEKMLFFFNGKPSYGLPEEEALAPEPQPPQDEQEEPAQEEEQEDSEDSKTLSRLTYSVVGRLVNRVTKSIERHSKKEDWSQYIRDGLFTDHRDLAIKQLSMFANAEQIVDEWLNELSEELHSVTKHDLAVVIDRQEQQIKTLTDKLGV